MFAEFLLLFLIFPLYARRCWVNSLNNKGYRVLSIIICLLTISESFDLI